MKTISKSKNKLLIIVSTIITVALICVAAIVHLSPKAGAETEGIFTYTVSNDEATITACDTNASGDIIIPETLGGYPVRVIGEKAFYKIKNISSVAISDSVISIGRFAFSDCDNLNQITIGKSVAHIDTRAFDEGNYRLNRIIVDENNQYYSSDENGILFDKSKTELIRYPRANTATEYEIPDSVTKIGDFSFSGCGNLQNIIIPAGVVEIGNSAFSSCNGFEEISIPNSVKTISEGAFNWCTNLKNINLPNSLKSIESKTFNHCIGLESINIPYGVESIGDYAFSECNALLDLLIPNTVTSIGNYAFNKCTSLDELDIPDSVIRIGNRAFPNYGITSIKVGKGLSEIGEEALVANRITVDDDNLYYSSDSFGALFNKEKTVLIRLPIFSEATDYSIPDTVVTIKNYACSVSNLNNILIPDSVKSIGDFAFCKSGLTEITIPDSVESFGVSAFASSNIKSAVIGNGIETISVSSFERCANLEMVSIGNSVKIIENSAFLLCTNLASVIIPNSVRIIDKWAFMECNNLGELSLGDNLQSIGEYAFNKCRLIKELKIPDSVEYIGLGAFEGCIGIENVILGKGLTNIPDYAFSVCHGLKSITLSDCITSVGLWAFWNCDAIEDVYFFGDSSKWYSMEVDKENDFFRNANIHFSNTVTLDYGNKIESIMLFPGDTLDFIETPSKEGYTFSCWLDENGESTEIPAIMPEKDLSFTASWAPNYYNAVFNANGGKWADGFGEKSFSTAFDSAIEAPEAPNKQGYIFSGWSLNGENIGSLPGVMDDVNGKEYTAIWIPATDTVYKAITYTMNTSGEYEESVQILSGETDAEVSAELPEISNGFTLNKNASTLKGIISADNSLVLKIYIDRNVYSFTVIDGEKTTENKYFYGQAVYEPGTPVKDGYIFDCWLDENGETAQIGNTMPDKNIVLTAKYKRFQESPNGSVSVSYEDSCFDEEAFLSVKSIESNHEDHGIYIRDINLKRIKTFNIKMENSKSEEINPNPGTSVTVTIQIPEDYLNQENYTLIHIIEGNKNERFSTNPKSNEKKLSISDDGKYFIFEIDHFSYFVLCVEQTPVSIKVASAPNKTSYFYKIDKSLDTDGFALEVTYDDGSSEIITDTSMMTFSGFDSSKAGEQTVTVEYGKLKTDFKVNVRYTWWQWIIRILLLGFLWY